MSVPARFHRASLDKLSLMASNPPSLRIECPSNPDKNVHPTYSQTKIKIIIENTNKIRNSLSIHMCQCLSLY